MPKKIWPADKPLPAFASENAEALWWDKWDLDWLGLADELRTMDGKRVRFHPTEDEVAPRKVARR